MPDAHENLSFRRVHTVTRKQMPRIPVKSLKSVFEEARPGSEFENISKIPSCDPDRTPDIEKKDSLLKRNFEFVTLTGQPSAITRSATSKKVRTQAMRDYLRKQHRQAISGVVEVVESTNPEEPAQYKGKFKLASWTHKSKKKSAVARREKLLGAAAILSEEDRRTDEDSVMANVDWEIWQSHKASNPVSTVSSGSLDPFDTLCIKLGPLSERLLVYYNTAYTMNSIAINAEGDFFSYIKTDPTLFHSILYLVALHSDLKSGLQDSPACLYHGSEAFRVINERLGDSSGVFSDATIAAVAMLVNKENLNGRYELSEIHKQGLEKMIRMRGGVHVLRGVFQRVVTWSDFCYANVWSCKPSFPRLLPRPSMYTSQEIDSTLLKPSHLFGTSSPIIPIFHALRNLSECLSSKIASLSRMEASSTIYSLEYDLLSLNKPLPTSPEALTGTLSAEAVPLKIAAHIYLWLAIRELPPTSELVYRLVQRLQGSLIGVLPGWWTSSRERQVWLLWIMFIGGIASAARLERLWFVSEMVDICPALGIWDEEALMGCLKNVLWQDEFCSDRLNLLWQDMVLSSDIGGDNWITQ
ncbi:hypothetical protein IFR05_012779 [Cadophora sp. M221]|nr:hypothetical protein IFR05_012779 [Cadophora sp. M221]